MDLAHFSERAKKFKTTGYTDFSTAFFDQRMRLFCTEKILRRHNSGGAVLDFGCGSGDFLVHLARRINWADGYDPCETVVKIAKAKTKRLPNVWIWKNRDELYPPYDVILSVTVLQHIRLLSELQETLGFLYDSLVSGGLFIALESVYGDYQFPPPVVSRRYEDWVLLFEAAGFRVIERIPFFNAQYALTPSFGRYLDKTRLVRFLYGRFNRFLWNTRLFNPYFETKAREALPDIDSADGFEVESSINHFFVMTK